MWGGTGFGFGEGLLLGNYIPDLPKVPHRFFFFLLLNN